MMYDVRQVTTYDYDFEVPSSRHVLHVTPRTRPGQTVISSFLNVGPPPAERTDWVDFFGNPTTTINIDQPHDGLMILARAQVSVEPGPPHDPLATPPWQSIRRQAYETRSLDAASPAHFIYPSRDIPLDNAIRDYAAESFLADRPMLDGAIELMHRMHADFAFDSSATETGTTPGEAFRLGRGVCQDFANIMIAGLRGLGLPACYVSGFIRTIPPAGGPRLIGADASHAWVMAWCGDGVGWVGLDPTNALLAREDHIVVAVGRDYADVAPVGGVIVASGGQRLSVEVDVIPHGEHARPLHLP